MRAVSKFTMPACVEMCMGKFGTCVLQSFSTPRSATISASTPAASAAFKKSGMVSISSLRGRVLQVKYTFTPCLWAKSTAFCSASIVKFFGPARIPNCVVPR